MKKIKKTKIIQLPKILDERGNLSFIEEKKHIPFEIKRVYLIYDVPGGEIRGSHAYKTLQEFIVVLHNSEKEYKIPLNRSYYGIYVQELY
ncbi:sugar 3,4-ketoisomerase [Calditrichota bacterium LG25]